MNSESELPLNRTILMNEDGSAEFRKDNNESRYTFHKLHAAGGIGEIWLARDLDLDREVAVKKLQTQQVPSEMTKVRFLREARITGQLDHPGVVPIYEICQDESTGLPYYTMRFLRGRTLSEAVKTYHCGQRLMKPLLGLLNAFDIVCHTVAYAHSKGIIHRDLKCDNIILGDYGEVVVIDWGLAKQHGCGEVATGEVDLNTFSPSATMAGQIMGTPAYMAPEQAAGETDSIGPATDVYGLSAILYEVLCGQPPFAGKNTVEVLRQVQHETPVPPSEISPGVPPALEQICLKGLDKLPSGRHASAEELANAVRAWVSELAEKRQAEAERERFFALSQDLLGIVDAKGALRQVSPAWSTLLGYDRDALIGQPFLNQIFIDDKAEAMQSFEAVSAEQQAATIVTKALHADGTTRWVSWNITPIAKEQSLYVVGRDITELKESQQLFEGILQSAPDAIVLINPQGRITMVNRQAENIFGYEQSELVGEPIEILVPHRFREKHPSQVSSFFASSSFRPMGSGMTLWGLRKDGSEFTVEISLSAIEMESTTLVAASVRDISSREKHDSLNAPSM